MWGSWEDAYGCTRRVLADLAGYRRTFNKASVDRWGSQQSPCPTLNVEEVGAGFCRGIAFQFPEEKKDAILAYLREREGNHFALREMQISLDTGAIVSAFVPLYQGKNVIHSANVAETAEMVWSAKGRKGPCINYVKRLFDKLSELGISDPVVVEFMDAVEQHGKRAV